jgi:hypothetical protein
VREPGTHLYFMGPGSRPLRELGRDDSRLPLGKSCRARQFRAGAGPARSL